MRQIGLGLGGLFLADRLAETLPAMGPSLAAPIRAGYPGLGIPENWLPLLPVAAIAAIAAPVAGLMLPFNPPIEHGFGTSLGHVFAHRPFRTSRFGVQMANMWPRQQVAEHLGGIVCAGDVLESDRGLHAVWEVPTHNLRLADGAAVEVQQGLYAEMLAGLTVPLQLVTTATRVDVDSVVGRIESSDREEARSVASWLKAQVIGRNLVERRSFVAIVAPDESTLADYVQNIDEGLGQQGFRADMVRRLRDDELAAVVQRTWSARAPGKELGPYGPWNVSANQVVSDGEYHEVLALSKWPRAIRDNYLAPFIDGAHAIDVAMHIAPVSSTSILDGLERRLNAMKASRPDRRRLVAINDLEAFMAALECGEQQAFDAEVLFHVHGKSLQQVQSDSKRILNLVKRTGGEAQRLRWEQPDALIDVAPLGVQTLKRRTRRVDTASAQRMYAWTASAMWPEGSVPWGETLDSRRPVGWTPWRRPLIANPHLIIYALSGGGKGFGAKVVLSRLLFAGETQELFAFDQAEEDLALGEYGRWASYCGMEYRHIRSLDDLPAALADLDDYRWLGPGVCWNIAQLPLADRPEVLFTVKAAIFKRAAEHPARRQWVNDELWSFLVGADQMGADPKAVALSNGAIEDLIRRGRHVKVGGVFMTQRVRDSLSSQVMQILQSQAASQWYGMQMPGEITHVVPLLHWTPSEVAAIKKFVPGQGLLAAGPWRVTMRVTASDQEYDAFNTDGRIERDAVRTGGAELEGCDEPAAGGDRDDRPAARTLHVVEPAA